MGMQIHVAKLVGAASAPVALSIASSISMSNLSAKYAMLAGGLRQLSDEYRKSEDKNTIRSRSLADQMIVLRRLRLLMIATFWLAVSILCFIPTLICTSVSVFMPKWIAWTILTAAFSFVGMLVLGSTVVIEILENRCAKQY